MTRNYNPKAYGELLLDALPGIIETEEENEKALAVVYGIMSKGEDKISPEHLRHSFSSMN